MLQAASSTAASPQGQHGLWHMLAVADQTKSCSAFTAAAAKVPCYAATWVPQRNRLASSTLCPMLLQLTRANSKKKGVRCACMVRIAQ